MNPVAAWMQKITDGIEYYFGLAIGAASTLLAGGSDLRALEQASNIVLPNALPAQGEIIESMRRGNLSKAQAQSLMLRMGFDGATSASILALDEVLLQADSLVRLRLRGEIDAAAYTLRSSMIGLSEQSATQLYALAELRLNPADIFSAIHRGFVTDTTGQGSVRDLADQGYTPERVAILEKLSLSVPGMQELFQFAAWQSENDAIALKYGLDKGMPASFLGDALSANIPPEYAKRAWRSHWQVPSLFILRQLAQTGQFTDEDLTAMLTTFQIPPIFITSIVQAFKKPPSVANIEQGVVDGTIDPSKVAAMVSSLGYSSVNADLITTQILTAAAKKAATEATAASKVPAQFKGESESLVVQSYIDGIIDRPTATKHLADLNIQADVSEMILGIADYKIARTALNDEIAYIENSFLLGEITINTANTALSSLGLAPDQVAKALIKIERASKKQASLPTLAELEKFLKLTIIDAPTFILECRNIGYADRYIQWFLMEAGYTQDQITPLFS